MYAGGIGEFCSYATNPAYGWVDYCEGTFGDVPSQIVFDWNSPRHTSDNAVPASRRALTRPELQTLFDHMDDAVDREYAAGSKRWMSLLRNSVAFKLCYAFGLRKRELTMLELVDFGPNPHVPAYGVYGALTVRWGKGTAGSGPRRRTVLTVPEFERVILFSSIGSPLVSEIAFRRLRAARLYGPANVNHASLHCLRHSYVTHLLEAGYDPTFVQTQVGHQNASKTGICTSVSADFKQKEIHRMIAQRVAQLQEGRSA